ncbi:MAG: LacI family DNA-binding transcriptional regulator [Lachnospiraceae bacterium]|nr:LacI family DNA-binding transcriptional regulator [Lachnospiraceae bacterium]
MTINEIAEMAGVSRATVSRYLNDGYVSEEKKERIRKVIAETGYTPSASAKLLRANRTSLIGVIIPKINSDSISRMVSGISRSLKEHNYQMLLAVTENNELEEIRYLKTLSQNRVDGIILFGTIFTPEHLKVLKEISTPVIVLTQKLDGYTCIYSDDYHAALSLGCLMGKTARNPALITVTERDLAVGHNRRTGLLDGLKENGLTLKEDHIAESAFNMDSGYTAAAALMERDPEIDTILCATDTIASGAVRYLHEHGIDIPSQVQVTGFGDSSISRAITPTLTTVHFYYEEAGERASDLLLEEINSSGPTVIREIQLAFDIVQRQSTRDAKK